METLLWSLGFFIFGYVLNMFYITVLYHRGLTHGAVQLHPALHKLLSLTGTWITGLDPKSWATMHRFHHKYSDTITDPHSPTHAGVMGVWVAQYKSYLKYMNHLIKKDSDEVNTLSADMNMEVSWLNRKNLSWLPYIIHIIIAVIIWQGLNSFVIGAAYWFGIMSHPLQGWMVNALAHKYGGRNFNTPDDSRNNLFVGYFVFGEGYQNNHHHSPQSAKFSVKTWELDLGYFMVIVAEKFGMLKVTPSKLN
jgi:stearoyl-CoA desaturase (delta-9 desaturase)